MKCVYGDWRVLAKVVVKLGKGGFFGYNGRKLRNREEQRYVLGERSETASLAGAGEGT